MDTCSNATANPFSPGHASAAPGCAEAIVCNCLAVTAGDVHQAIAATGAQTVKELGRCTGAGQGCTACHGWLRQLIAAHRTGRTDSSIREEVSLAFERTDELASLERRSFRSTLG